MKWSDLDQRRVISEQKRSFPHKKKLTNRRKQKEFIVSIKK